MRKWICALLMMFIVSFAGIQCNAADVSPASEAIEAEALDDVQEELSLADQIKALEGLTLEEAEETLAKLKIKNIEYDVIEDLLFEDTDKDHIITKILIDKDLDQPNSVNGVTLTYHTYDSIRFPITAKEIENSYYEAIKDALFFAGYTNVESQIVYEDFKGDNADKEFYNTIEVLGTEMLYDKNIEIITNTPFLIVGHFKQKYHNVEIIFSSDSEDSIGIAIDEVDKGELSDKNSLSLSEGTHQIILYDKNKEEILLEDSVDVDEDLEIGIVLISDEDKTDVKVTKESVTEEATSEIILDDYFIPMTYMKVEDAESMLKGMGFENITLKPIYDISETSNPIRKISEIKIGDNKVSVIGDSYKKDTPIIITCHKRVEENPNRLVMPCSSDDIMKLNVEKAKQKLTDIGFDRIVEKETMVNDTKEAGITTISISGRSFKKGDVLYKTNTALIAYNTAYTYTSENKVMYAVDDTVCIDYPTKDGEESIVLEKEKKVKIVGKCNETGYLKINVDGDIAYITEDKLTDVAPPPFGSRISDYTFTEASGTKYAKGTMNVRNLPNTNGEVIGQLAQNDAVQISGICNETQWYRFTYNGKIAYGLNTYLLDNKTEIVVVPSSGGGSGSGSSSGSGEAIGSGDDTIMVYIPNKGGTKYHCKATCSNMDNPSYVTLSYAKSHGFSPCKKCYK